MPEYPLVSFHFQVQWGGTRIGFAEISGLDLQTEVIEYREGSNPNYSSVKIPGLRKYSNITLKRGIVKGDNEFFKWWNSIKLNAVERRDVIISLLNENHEPVVNWKIINAFPVKIQCGDLKASGNEVAIETLELAHEGVTIENE